MRRNARPPMAHRLVTVLSLLGLVLDLAQPLASVSSAAEPLRGVLHLLVDDPTNPLRRNLRLDQSGVLPLRAGDRFRIEARLSRPAYLYLFWLGSDAKVSSIYPWKPGRWDARPEREAKIDRLELPAETDKAWEIPTGSPGVETLLLLVREASPLPPRHEENLARLLSGTRVSSSVLIKEAVWLENGREITLDPQDRALPSSKTRKSDDPVLRIRRLLSDKVQPLGDYYQAIVFPSRGGM